MIRARRGLTVAGIVVGAVARHASARAEKASSAWRRVSKSTRRRSRSGSGLGQRIRGLEEVSMSAFSWPSAPSSPVSTGACGRSPPPWSSCSSPAGRCITRALRRGAATATTTIKDANDAARGKASRQGADAGGSLLRQRRHLDRARGCATRNSLPVSRPCGVITDDLRDVDVTTSRRSAPPRYAFRARRRRPLLDTVMRNTRLTYEASSRSRSSRSWRSRPSSW